MKWLLLFLLPLSTLAQTLPPGTYRDLKPNQPLLLDTGSYTFIGLEMKNLGKGIWLDGRKARSLTVLNSRFEGKHSGTAIATNNHATITNCIFKNLEKGICATVLPNPSKKKTQSRTGNTFTRLDYGMIVPNGTASTTTPYSIMGNTFSSNKTGIYLDNGTFNLEMRCNIFETDENLFEEERVGLQLGEGAVIVNDGIGGNGTPPNPKPNANVWPWVWVGTSPNQTRESPPNWTSLAKVPEGPDLNYFHYFNEIIGTVSPTSGVGQVIPQPFLTAASPKVVKDWCETYYPASTDEELYLACLADPTDPVLNGEQWDIQTQGVPSCYELLDDEVDFFARQNLGQNTTQVHDPSFIKQGYLGEAVPNPSSKTCSISIIWNQDKGKLVVFDLATGKEVWSKMLTSGKQKMEIDVSKLASGVYGYRLEGDCPCPEPKRLVVVN
ncbi:MAG TPA: NosD domain-containing protein [Catalimonadaceae bacterium]|nr:NosD domain-containing protein [Catalimonadaceae bacterium]